MIKTNPLWVILLTVFVDVLGIGILIPVMPLLLADPLSPHYLLPNGMSVNQGYQLLGLITAIFPFMQFLATPILGQLSDKFGRKKILAISLAGTCISYILFAYAIIIRNIPLLIAARALDGITGGNISVAQAAIADITPPEKRSKNFGFMGAVFGMGFIIGPFIGGKLSDNNLISWFNAATPFWFAAILSFINVLLVLFIFPETRKILQHHIKINWNKSVHNILHAFGNKIMRPIFITNFFYQGGFTFFTTFFGVFLINKFAFNQGHIGNYFAYVGLWIAITQGFITGRLANKFSEKSILKYSILGTSLVTISFFFVNYPWVLLFITPLHAMSIGLTQANLPAIISKSAGPEIQGEMLGINASVQALAQSIPPILSGYIASLLSPQSPVFTAGIVIFVSWLVFVTMYHPKNEVS